MTAKNSTVLERGAKNNGEERGRWEKSPIDKSAVETDVLGPF